MRVSRHAEIIITRTQLKARTTERYSEREKESGMDEKEREGEKRQDRKRVYEEPSTEGGSEARVSVIMESIARARDASLGTRGKQSVY